MTSRPRITAALALVLGVAGCAAPAPRSRADLGAQASCRARTDEAYNRQNRAAIFQADNYAGNLRDSPFASSGSRDVGTRGLSDEYAEQNAMQACLQGIGQPPDTAIEVTPGVGAAPKR